MKVLVTGGAGFIGSNFIRYWLSKNPRDEVINLDDLTYAGHLFSTVDFAKNKNYRFVKGSICDLDLLSNVMEGVDIVVNFAAESHVDRSIVNPSAFIETNVLGTQRLLEVSVRKKIKRFHHVSTDEVFGSLSIDEDSKFTENTPYNPRSPYSASKAASDHLVRAYFYTYDLPITITNCSNNFGPYQDPEKFIPRMITNLIDDKPIQIYGDGNYFRDWLYVDDCCRAIDLVIRKGEVGETYLVGGLDSSVSNLHLAKEILKMFGKDDSYIHFVKDRPGHDRKYLVDWSKIKKLGFTPKYKFYQALKKTVDWYVENEWWWRSIKGISEFFYSTMAAS